MASTTAMQPSGMASMAVRVEMSSQDYATACSFALASLLTMLALVTLVVKAVLERRESNDARMRLGDENMAGATPQAAEGRITP